MLSYLFPKTPKTAAALTVVLTAWLKYRPLLKSAISGEGRAMGASAPPLHHEPWKSAHCEKTTK